METLTLTLAAYLEKNPESKRLNKRFARALKIYVHAAKDISHAAADLAHAKEDCTFALQSAAQIIDEHREILDEWALPQAEETVTVIDLGIEGSEVDSDDEEADSEVAERDPAEEVATHLRHAMRDIGDALSDAESAIRCLDKADDLIFDILSIAEKDEIQIAESEAKSYLIQKAKEIAAAKATAPEKPAPES